MQKTSLKMNFLMNALLTMSTFLFPLITFPYISRVLLPEGTGRVTFATSLINYFNMIAQLGIPTYGIRACAKVREDRQALSRTVQELLAINLVTSLVSYLALALGLLWVPRLREDRALYIIISASILLNAVGMEWLYKALEQYAYITKRSVFFKLLSVAAMFALVHSPKDYIIYGGLTIFAASASNVLNLFYAHRYVDWKLQRDLKPLRHIKPIAVFFGMVCATTIYTNLDEFMLGLMKTNTDVGYYYAAVRIKVILVSIVTSLGTVLLPRSSYYVEHGLLEEFYRISAKALRFVFLLASPLVIYFMLYAGDGILFLSGSAYGGSVVPMQIIMPTLLFIGITNILGIQILIPLGREVDVLYSVTAGAVTDLILNLLLIPRYGAAGASMGTMAAEAVVLLVQLWILRKKIGGAFRSIPYGKMAAALALGTAACLWVPRLRLNSFFTLAISASLFFGVYGVTLLVTRESLVMELMQQALGILKKRKT